MIFIDERFSDIQWYVVHVDLSVLDSNASCFSRSQSGRATPSRSRHQSGKSTAGRATPLSSIFDDGSLCGGATGNDDDHGYDGGSSDGEDDGGSLLSSTLWWDGGAARALRPPLPDFWLVMKLEWDVVHLYFHARFKKRRQILIQINPSLLQYYCLSFFSQINARLSRQQRAQSSVC